MIILLQPPGGFINIYNTSLCCPQTLLPTAALIIYNNFRQKVHNYRACFCKVSRDCVCLKSSKLVSSVLTLLSYELADGKTSVLLV